MTTPPPEPTRQAVADLMSLVIAGRMTREAASSWARPWIMAEDSGVEDPAVWGALVLVSGIDLRHGQPGGRWLYPPEQIEEWRKDLLTP